MGGELVLSPFQVQTSGLNVNAFPYKRSMHVTQVMFKDVLRSKEPV